MNESRSRVKGLGEVSLRVQDLDVMQQFYGNVVGLEVLRRDESFVFFKVAEGYGGHTQNLALFEAADLDFLGTSLRTSALTRPRCITSRSTSRSTITRPRGSGSWVWD